MERKLMTVGIILLFVGVCCISVNALPIQNSLLSLPRVNWLYVGGDGPGNYSTIPEAIDNASEGDTVYVYAGTYKNVTIDKPLQLLGEDKHTTIINGTGSHNAVYVDANAVNISGFTIQNRDTLAGKGICIQDRRNNIMVTDTILTHTYVGIIFWWNTNILLYNITFSANDEGICFQFGKNCTIIDCIFTHNGAGINAGYSPYTTGASFVIKDNLFLHNSVGLDIYECIDTLGNTTIEGNSFQQNYYGITIDSCRGVGITKNNFINNTRQVVLSRNSYVREIPGLLPYRQHWRNNFWDDWNLNLRYVIHGHWTLYVGADLETFTICRFPIKEYDPAPAHEPYNIGENR